MMRARRGFTLWEMAIVLAIMAVAAGMVIPSLNARFGNDPAAQAGDVVAALLRDARRAAIDGNQTVVVRIDPTSGMYQIDSTGVSGTGMLSSGTLDLSAWESLSTDLPRLLYVFRPTGATFGDSVVIRGMNGTVVLAVDPWSGNPYVYAQ